LTLKVLKKEAGEKINMIISRLIHTLSTRYPQIQATYQQLELKHILITAYYIIIIILYIIYINKLNAFPQKETVKKEAPFKHSH